MSTNCFLRHLGSLVLFLLCLSVCGQSVKDVNTSRIVELESIQTSSGTFIVASMERNSASESRVVIHRSTNNGMNWQLIDSIGKTISRPLEGVDPVLALDDVGNIYLALMRVESQGSFPQTHLEVYRSTDDGQSWAYRSSLQTDTVVADYPQIIARNNGELYLVYSGLVNLSAYPVAEVYFKRSLDGGLSWDIQNKVSVPNKKVSVPNIDWIDQQKLMVSYGHRNSTAIYVVNSSDSGTTWGTPRKIPNSNIFNICKPLSSSVGIVGIISHIPHQDAGSINYHQKQINDTVWQSQIIGNGAYAEGYIDSAGNIHVVYLNDCSLTFTYTTLTQQTVDKVLAIL